MSSISTPLPDRALVLHRDSVFAESYKDSAGADQTRLRRVLWFDKDSRKVVLFDVVDDRKLHQPYFDDLDAIQQLIRSGHYQLTKYVLPDFMLRADDYVASTEVLQAKWQRMIDVRDRTWPMILPLLDQQLEPEIYHRSTRGPIVSEIADKYDKYPAEVLNFLYRAYKYGRIPNSVLPHWPKSGAPGKRREPKTAKRGRKPKVVVSGHAPENIGINVNKDIRDLIILGVNAFCGKDDEAHISRAYGLTKERFFVAYEDRADGSRVKVPLPSNRVPTEGQFRYYAKQRFKEMDFVRSRLGEHAYLLKGRGLHGTARSGLLGPGHHYEIDATIADVYLRSRFRADWVVGRPVIYVVIDTFSRLIVGLYIGLIGPSWEGARLAIANALTEKVSFCKRFDLEITDAQWPAHHFPYELVPDRGEILSDAGVTAVKSLGIQMGVPGPYRPDWKPVVERTFKLLNDEQIKWLPGAVRQRWEEVRKRQYVLDAALTIDEFTRIILCCVLEHNQFTPLDKLLLTQDMITAGIKPYPIEMWNWGVANMTGPLRGEDPDLVRTHLLPSATAAVTERGILFNKLLYTCDRAIAEDWFGKARNFGRWSVPIRSEYVTDRIHLAPPVVPTYEECRLVDPNEKYANMRIEEAIDCLEYLSLSSTDLSDRDERGRLALHAKAESTLQGAMKRKREQRKSSPKSAVPTDIRDHRELEKHVERVQESRTHGHPKANVIPLTKGRELTKRSKPTSDDSELMDVIAQLRENEWEKPE